MNELSWTGERLVTSVTDVHGVVEHLHRYALALELAKNKVVLDIASGEGYGSNLLSRVASQVTGVDISEESVAHANNKYKGKNLSFKVGSTSKIPLPDHSIDLVVTFETLEHHDEHDEMMYEIRRVLKEDGVLIISSPEKTIYKDRDPNNPYHIKELDLEEFSTLLKANFNDVKIYNQRFVFGSLIHEIESPEAFAMYDGDYSSISNKLKYDRVYNRPFFNLAIASQDLSKHKIPGTSLFNGLSVLYKELAILNKQSADYKEQIQKIKQSYSYKIGTIVVKPIAIIKGILFKK